MNYKEHYETWRLGLSPPQSWAKEGPVEIIFEQGFLAAEKAQRAEQKMTTQRLVFEADVGDGYTYGYTYVAPLLAESPEQAYIDFESLYLQAKKNRETFTFVGERWNPSDFECEGEFYPPRILTIDEWFSTQGEQS